MNAQANEVHTPDPDLVWMRTISYLQEGNLKTNVFEISPPGFDRPNQMNGVMVLWTGDRQQVEQLAEMIQQSGKMDIPQLVNSLPEAVEFGTIMYGQSDSFTRHAFHDACMPLDNPQLESVRQSIRQVCQSNELKSILFDGTPAIAGEEGMSIEDELEVALALQRALGKGQVEVFQAFVLEGDHHLSVAVALKLEGNGDSIYLNRDGAHQALEFVDNTNMISTVPPSADLMQNISPDRVNRLAGAVSQQMQQMGQKQTAKKSSDLER